MSNSYYNSTFTAAIGTLARSSTLRSQFTLVETGVTAMEAALATKASPTFTGTTTLANVSYTGTLTGGTGVLNIGSGQIYKDAAGNVGFGNAPAQRVTLYTGGFNSAVAQFANGATGVAALNGTLVGTDSVGSGVVMVQQAFPLILGTNLLERMRIDSSGNVGIGLTNPQQKLHVNGSFQLASGSNLQWSAYSAGATGELLYATAALGIVMVTAGNERMRVKPTGSVVFVPIGAPAAPQEGEVYYDSSTHKHYGWNGSAWNAFY